MIHVLCRICCQKLQRGGIDFIIQLKEGRFPMEEIRIELTKEPKAKPADESKLGFGTIFYRSYVHHEL